MAGKRVREFLMVINVDSLLPEGVCLVCVALRSFHLSRSDTTLRQWRQLHPWSWWFHLCSLKPFSRKIQDNLTHWCGPKHEGNRENCLHAFDQLMPDISWGQQRQLPPCMPLINAELILHKGNRGDCPYAPDQCRLNTSWWHPARCRPVTVWRQNLMRCGCPFLSEYNIQIQIQRQQRQLPQYPPGALVPLKTRQL